MRASESRNSVRRQFDRGPAQGNVRRGEPPACEIIRFQVDSDDRAARVLIQLGCGPARLDRLQAAARRQRDRQRTVTFQDESFTA